MSGQLYLLHHICFILYNLFSKPFEIKLIFDVVFNESYYLETILVFCATKKFWFTYK